MAELAEQVAANKIVKMLDAATHRKNLGSFIVGGTKGFAEMFPGSRQASDLQADWTRGAAVRFR